MLNVYLLLELPSRGRKLYQLPQVSQRFYTAKTNTYVHFSNRETEARVWLCDLPTRKRKQRKWGFKCRQEPFRVGMLSLCGPRADTVRGVRNTVPVGSRGSSGVNACSIAGYGFCMEKKRSSKLNFPSCDSATGGSGERLALWPGHCGRPGRSAEGREKPGKEAGGPPQAAASMAQTRQLPSGHWQRGAAFLPPSLPRPRPAGPRGQPRTYTMAGGATSEASAGCGSDGSAARRSAAGPEARRVPAGGGLVRAHGDPPLPEGSGLWSGRSLVSSEVHPSLLHSVPCTARGLFLSLGLSSLCGNNLWKHSNGNIFK